MKPAKFCSGCSGWQAKIVLQTANSGRAGLDIPTNITAVCSYYRKCKPPLPTCLPHISHPKILTSSANMIYLHFMVSTCVGKQRLYFTYNAQELHQQSNSNGNLTFLKAISPLLEPSPKRSVNHGHALLLSKTLRRRYFLIPRSQSGLRTADTLFHRISCRATEV